MIKRLLILFFLLLLAAGAFLYWSLGLPYKGFPNEVFLDIPLKTPTVEMAKMLRVAGVIKSDWQFLLARAISSRANLQAGEYRFADPASVWKVFGRIASGDIHTYELRVPEGSNYFDIANLVQEMQLIRAEDFRNAAKDPALIRDLAPSSPSLEGYLFPATYKITRHTTARQLCQQMTDRFRREWKEIAKGAVDVQRTATLASLIEKETAVPSERPTVASVFQNRLDLNMTLDCDPTTIYAALLENRYRGKIYQSDLQSQNPYNTYRHAGLPPGPIANAGSESLKAALSPADTDFLFFVAKPGGAGQHSFSRSMSEHADAVRAYRSGQAR